MSSEVLYALDQNNEFDNILNNALSLISPLTGNLDVSTMELMFTSASADATATGRLRRNGTWLTWHDGVAARGLGGKLIRKTADETVNSGSTGSTLQNDDHLVYALAASEAVAFQCFVSFNSGTTPDIKFAFTVPASATLRWSVAGAHVNNDGTSILQQAITVSGTSLGLTGAASDDQAVLLVGTVINSTNAGNLQFQFAQQTADAGNTTVRTNSWLRVERF